MRLRWKETNLHSYKLQMYVAPSMHGPLMAQGEWIDVPVFNKDDKQIDARVVSTQLNSPINPTS